MSSKHKIGLFFGSFDPIHNGHLAIAQKALEIVDEVILVIAKQNPFKEPYQTSFEDRHKMCNWATMLCDDISASKIEQNLSGKTWDSLEELKHIYNNSELYIICGDDTFFEIENWYKGEVILEQYKFLVFKRDYPKSVTIRDNAQILNLIGFDKVSSTLVRTLIKDHSNMVKCYVPYTVYKYIKNNNLYVDDRAT